MPAKAGIPSPQGYALHMAKGGYIYIMTNRRGGVLYIGVTSNLRARVFQHRAGQGGDFTTRYRLKRLVYFEKYGSIVDAIAREKAMKAWQRAWKIEAIEKANPQWRDLYDELHLY